MFCNKCGKELAQNIHFCGNCGNKIENNVNSVNQSIENNKIYLTEDEKNTFLTKAAFISFVITIPAVVLFAFLIGSNPYLLIPLFIIIYTLSYIIFYRKLKNGEAKLISKIAYGVIACLGIVGIIFIFYDRLLKQIVDPIAKSTVEWVGDQIETTQANKQQRENEREAERQNRIQQNQQRTTTQSNTQQNQKSETVRQSSGNLRNTSWYLNETYYTGGAPVNIGGGQWIPSTVLIFEEQLLEFGNGNYYFQKRIVSGGSDSREDESGSFNVSGNIVTLTSSTGERKSGSIAGNIITINGKELKKQ